MPPRQAEKARESNAPPAHRLSVSELSGRTVNYGYDSIYRLTSETIASDPGGQNGTVGYTYDAVGDRKQVTSTVPAIPAGTMFYDANDRFTAGDTYDANGNTVSSGGIANVYDFENHLTQKGGVTIVYDGDGNRVSKTVAGVTTKYLVDDRNPTGYAQVVFETFSGSSAPNRELNHIYVHGLELLGQTRSFVVNSNSNTQQIYYDYDGHGSVRALTDPNGNVTDTYDYDAFGNLLHSTGTTFNEFLFAGEQFDSDLGLYYNRARYLNVSTGRFWTMDTDEGKDGAPLSLHKYVYAANEPVNNVDRSGNEIDELIGSLGVFDTLQSMSAFQVAPFLNHAKVDVHFDFLASVFFRKYHHAYLVVSGAGGPPVVFRGGPSQNGCGAGAASKDTRGVDPSTDLGCGYLTKSGSGLPYAPGGPDYPSGPNDNVATVSVPNVVQSYNQVITKFTTAAQHIEDLHLPYQPISQNSNSFAHTLLVKSDLISPSPPVWAPGWEKVLY